MVNKRLILLISDLYEKIDEVSIDTIAPRISEEKLWNWCGAWQRDARAILNDLEREVMKMTINDLNMTEEQIVHEITFMRMFDKYLQKMLGGDKYHELSMGFARMLTSAELHSLGASEDEIEKACNFADMMAMADRSKADARD